MGPPHRKQVQLTSEKNKSFSFLQKILGILLAVGGVALKKTENKLGQDEWR